MTIYFSLLVALVGMLTYALSSNPKVQEIGQIAFFCGLLAFLLGMPAHPIGLPPNR